MVSTWFEFGLHFSTQDWTWSQLGLSLVSTFELDFSMVSTWSEFGFHFSTRNLASSQLGLNLVSTSQLGIGHGLNLV